MTMEKKHEDGTREERGDDDKGEERGEESLQYMYKS